MHGHTFLPLLDRKTEGWRNEAYFEKVSEYMTARGLRTPQFTTLLAAARTERPGWIFLLRARTVMRNI